MLKSAKSIRGKRNVRILFSLANGIFNLLIIKDFYRHVRESFGIGQDIAGDSSKIRDSCETGHNRMRLTGATARRICYWFIRHRTMEDRSLAPEPKPQDKVAGDYALLPPDAAHWALFLDLDGTLIDIADAPDGVAVPASLPPLLDRLSRLLDGALALVSGRPIAQIDRLFAPYRFAAAGLHGLQLRLPNGEVADDDVAGIAALRQRARELVAALPGTMLEDKDATLALHYRAAPQHRETLRQGALALIAKRPDLHLLAGKMVLEIKPRAIAKGKAVKKLASLAPFAGRTPIFVGDDVTDRDGFKAVRELGGRAVLVGDPKMAAACLVLPDPSAVRAWLGRLAGRLEQAA